MRMERVGAGWWVVHGACCVVSGGWHSAPHTSTALTCVWPPKMAAAVVVTGKSNCWSVGAVVATMEAATAAGAVVAATRSAPAVMSMREGTTTAGSTVAAPMLSTTAHPPSVKGDVGKAASFTDASFLARLVPPSRREGSAARAPPFPAPPANSSDASLCLGRSSRTSAEAEHVVPMTWLTQRQSNSSRTLRSPIACSRSSLKWPTLPGFARV